MPDPRNQPTPAHPEPWQSDLNPDYMAGQNMGLAGPHPEDDAHTAYDIKETHDLLQGFSDDELRRIPILPTGSRLEQGATYIDLRDPHRAEFTATGDQEAGPANWYVPKDRVGYLIWNRLIGVENPERLGLADEA